MEIKGIWGDCSQTVIMGFSFLAPDILEVHLESREDDSFKLTINFEEVVKLKYSDFKFALSQDYNVNGENRDPVIALVDNSSSARSIRSDAYGDKEGFEIFHYIVFGTERIIEIFCHTKFLDI